MNIVKVSVLSKSEIDILKVIPEHYSIEVMSGIGYAIKNVNGRMVGSCQVTSHQTLSVYAYTPTQKIKRAFIAAFEKHNKCKFVEVK